jgi:hypothetical protein
MAGRKFGTNGSEWQTWSMNAVLPSYVIRRFKNSGFVVFSSGNIYPQVKIANGGADENVKPNPVGEYGMSVLARERVFEYGANAFGAKVFFHRLCYAVDLRYGVLYDISQKLMNNEEISLSMPVFNCVWQGYANEIALRGLLRCASPAEAVNVTGPEMAPVKYAAEKLGEYLGKTPKFTGEPSDTSLLWNADKCVRLFGYPRFGMADLLKMQADWIISGGRGLGKPTHFEEKKGDF